MPLVRRKIGPRTMGYNRTVRTHAPTSAPGDLIGDYRIERMLGEGGMGAVYAAVHDVIDKRVALKVLRRELCRAPEFVQRFVKEARAVNRIGHPNIVDVFGFGRTSDGRAFLAMELLEGETLTTRLAAGPLETPEACNIGIEIAHALEAAHQAGVIHRDLKPDNVFLARLHGRSVVKLLDFGIAKLSGDTSGTQMGAMLGTPMYIAPEQARGIQLDGRADIYALGVMLFEMLTGQPPFDSDNAIELAALHITEPPPVASSIRHVPRIADVMIGRMLAKDPAERPTLADVRRFLEILRVDVGAGESGIIPVLRPRDDGDADSTFAALAASRPPRRWPLVIVGLLVLAIGFAAVVLVWPYIMR